MDEIGKILKDEKLKAGDRKEWEKRLEELQEMIRLEVDEKIDEAIKENDEWWEKDIGNN